MKKQYVFIGERRLAGSGDIGATIYFHGNNITITNIKFDGAIELVAPKLKNENNLYIVGSPVVDACRWMVSNNLNTFYAFILISVDGFNFYQIVFWFDHDIDLVAFKLRFDTTRINKASLLECFN